ncbi:MAG: SDR family NAD(P)-dependent oxidoreductase [Hyphomicrobiales bacterium]|nr:SDR family NAD(P)-dependent oxidoreductase [Hyphomicrobiales bacterium]MBV9977133.1 SDR family NAD(P)-dependent oxidoreductase [Hyphomicrobiales bacterium]
MAEPSKEQRRIALVTGASRGIGRAAALALARAGCHIVALARTVGGLEELDDAIKRDGGSATLVPADLTDFSALDRLGAAIAKRWGRLDVFIGNAGLLGPITPLGHVEPAAWDRVMAVNVTANWRLLRAVDTSLRAAEHGRVVLVSSGAATACRAYWGPYSISKAALEALARTYAAETVTTPIRVMLVNPGPLRTAMRAEAMPGEDPTTLKTPQDLAPWFVKLTEPQWSETGKVFDFPREEIISR